MILDNRPRPFTREEVDLMKTAGLTKNDFLGYCGAWCLFFAEMVVRYQPDDVKNFLEGYVERMGVLTLYNILRCYSKGLKRRVCNKKNYANM